jgi:hypothetical protein
MNLRLGSRRGKVAIGIVVIAGLGFLLFRHPENAAQRAVEETRQALRQQGFKTDLADFDFSTPPAARGFETALAVFSRDLFTLRRFDPPNLLKPAGSNAAIVVWRQHGMTTSSGEAPWLLVTEAMEAESAELDAVCEAALSGRIRFNLPARQGGAMLLPHLAALKNLAQALGSRTVLDLHDDRKDAAWTNLLASTRLVTAWDPEPTEISHMVRFGMAEIAFDTAWQALQAQGWSEDRLARLQQEWESVDFFKGLPETAAFSRASEFAMYEQERLQPFAGGYPLMNLLKDALHSPRAAWSELNDEWRRARYRSRGIFEDERAQLLFYRDRELELRHACESPNWSQMRQLLGATNTVSFQSKNPSATLIRQRLNRMTLGFLGSGRTLLARAAEAEARRRLIVAAIALERFRSRHGVYPKSLGELTPDLVKQPFIDFMDGQPLRYRLTDDSDFELYALGPDCIDHGGRMPLPQQNPASDGYAPRGVPLQRQPGMPFTYGSFGRVGRTQEADLVWPRPASTAEADLMR